MSEKARAHVLISGRVQGVFFRMETQRAAEKTGGISGWVRNTADGRVETVFEGDRERVDSIIEWCHQGSPHSRVKAVDVEWEEYAGEFGRFDITYFEESLPLKEHVHLSDHRPVSIRLLLDDKVGGGE